MKDFDRKDHVDKVEEEDKLEEKKEKYRGRKQEGAGL